MSGKNAKFMAAGIEVAKTSGEIIKRGFMAEKTVKTKAGFADLVTETDEAVERHAISTLRERFPDHAFIGEESTAAGAESILTDAPTWMIDPVDGTTNFVHRVPHVCISMGLWIDREPQVAVVYNPILDEMFTASAGDGAFCNGDPIKVSGVKELKQSVLLCEVGNTREPGKLENIFSNLRSFVEDVHGLRSFGSAALNMCYVARGSAEAYYEYGLHCWDMAAAALVVREAGGVVVDPTGADFDVMSRRVLCAATPELTDIVAGRLSHLTLPRD